MLQRLSLCSFLCLAFPFALSAAELQRYAGTGSAPQLTAPYPEGEPVGAPGSIALGNPFGVEVRGDRVWLTTVDDQCIWQGDLQGTTLRRVAGDGTLGHGGDGALASQAQFNWPHEVRVDARENLFIADTRNHLIRMVDAETGHVRLLAGNGKAGYAGDGKAGDAVQFDQPHSVALDGAGGVLVADTKNHRIRRIDIATGRTETIAGTGERKLPADGDLAEGAPLFGPRSLAVDADSIWVALREGNSIWRIDRRSGRLEHIAGTGAKGYSGDGGPAADATLNGPKGLCATDDGGLLIVDTENHVVRRIDLETRQIETVIGGPDAAPQWQLKRPHGIAPIPGGGCLVADSENHRVLRWSPN